jgi:hypothetical protein
MFKASMFACVLHQIVSLQTPVEKLWLHGNHLDDASAEVVAKFLEVNSTVTHVSLSDNAISDKGL